MPVVPTFVLRKLYVAGSLRNVPAGCQLQIKNTLAPAIITGVGPVTIDDTTYEPHRVTLMRGNERLSAAEASPSRPLAFDINVVVTILVEGVTLAPGQHRVWLDVTSREAGRLKWDITDSVAA